MKSVVVNDSFELKQQHGQISISVITWLYVELQFKLDHIEVMFT